MDKSKSMTLKEIRSDNKEKRKEAKKIKNLRKNTIKEEKEIFKERIKIETNDEKRKVLRKEFKKKFWSGLDTNTGKNIIDITQLHKYFCNGINCEHIIKGIDLKIKQGDIVVILGPSGSGKSTLLNIMSGLTPPTKGSVIINGKNMLYLSEEQRTKFREKNISFVFQSYNLIPSLTVIENIKVGANLRSKDTEEIMIDEILETLGLTVQAKKYPFQLSGGQNQRISIGRALAKNPNLLFADEPTGALDEEKGKEALQLLLDINKKHKTTLIIVTHNPNFSEIANIVLYIKDGIIDNIVNNKKAKKAREINWS